MNWFAQPVPWWTWAWPAALAAVSLSLWRTTVSVAPALRIPLFVFHGFYILTTLLGGVIIGVTDSDVLYQLDYGLDLRFLTNVGTWSYWLMLFAPLLIPTAFYLILKDAKLLDETILHFIPRGETTIKPTGFITIFTLFAGYCLARLAWSGHLFAITTWHSAQSDYIGMIAVRYELHERMGSAFFGIIYIALPTLSFVALHQAAQTRQFEWAALSILSVCAVSFISLSLMQKSPFILYLMFLSLALLDLKVISTKLFITCGAGALLVLTVLQTLTLQNWNLQDSLNLILFRMASSFPYYLSIYPDLVSFTGVETGLHLIGMGTAATDNSLVFNYMYPDIPQQGAAAAPSHLRAYSQAGYLYAVITLALISLPLKAAELSHKHLRSPLAFAVYMGLLIQLYYVMQTSLREALLSCYGLFWVIVAVAATLSVSQRTQTTRATLPQRQVCQPQQRSLRKAA